MIEAALRDNYSMLRASERLIDLYQKGLIPKSKQDIEQALTGYSTGRGEAVNIISRLKTSLDYETLYWGQLVEREKAIARLHAITTGQIKVQAVRGFSFLGSSFIYVIFEEGTDIYWARSRILEYLQAVKNKIPADVNPVLGPDATSLGWGFSYAVVDESGGLDLAQLRSLQDYNVKLALESVAGVSQVASIGGFVNQYQITVDPNRLSAYNLPIGKVMEAMRKSNRDVEGRVLEFSGAEYMARGRGYLKNVKDLEDIAVGVSAAGTPIYLKDVARVQLGPEIRRGLAELDGKGEVTGGIVIVRFGENVLNVIERVKEKINKDITPSLPKGVKIVTTYDRSDLIHRSIATLKDEIIKLAIAVSIGCLIFLFHLPGALVVIVTLPIAIIISFICMYYLGVTSNIFLFTAGDYTNTGADDVVYPGGNSS